MERVYTQTFGVASALIEKDGNFLLVKESDDKVKNRWSIPGGGINVGESPIEAAKREVKEEAGIDFVPTHVLGVYSSVRKDLQKKFNITPHSIKIVFLGRVSKEDPKAVQDDILEVKWFSAKEIEDMGELELRNLNTKKIVKDYFSGKRYPLDLVSHSVNF